MPTMQMLSPFSWSDVTEWHLGILPIVLLLATLLTYLHLAKRATSWPLAPRLYFLGGILVTFLATESVIGTYDMTYIADHMIEHLMLIMIAAPLFAMSRPIDLLKASGPAWLQRALEGSVANVIFAPVFAFALYFIFIPATHLTGLFNLMMEHEWIHHLEQILFLVVGYLFFRVAFGQESGKTIHPGLRLVFVMAAVPADTITGLSLSMTSHDPVPVSVMMGPLGATNASRLSDVHFGGAIMWIGGDLLMLLACIPIAFMWVRFETQRTKELDAELDALGL